MFMSFSWISFPRHYSNFFKNSRRYCSWRCTTGIVDTSGISKKSSIRKFLHFFNTFGSQHIDNFFLLQVHIKVSAIWECSHYFPPISTTLAVLVAKLPPVVSLIPVVHRDLQISLWIFEKIRNEPNAIISQEYKRFCGRQWICWGPAPPASTGESFLS
jgi:hypothetical protein